MNIDLELYRIFYYVAINKSISRAAYELSISQPAISRSIINLENQLNVSLFIRKRDGVELSEDGQILFDKVKEMIEIVDSFENEIKLRNNLEKGIINIGASKTIIEEYLIKYIELFNKEYPNIIIKVYTDRTDTLIKKLNSGSIDILFTYDNATLSDDTVCIKLLELHDCLFASSKYNYLKDKTIKLKELNKLPLITLTKGATLRNKFDDFCINNSIKVESLMEFGSNSLVKLFTKSGFGVGLLTKEFIQDEIKSNSLFELKLEKELESKNLILGYNKSKKNNIILKKFIDIIKKTT